MGSLIPTEIIEKRILIIRGQKVMLDADLAELYGVEIKVLIQAAKRNLERFPADFMFQPLESKFNYFFAEERKVPSTQWGEG